MIGKWMALMLLLVAALPAAAAAPPVIEPHFPKPAEAIYDDTPTLLVNVTDPDGDLRLESLRFIVQGQDVAALEGAMRFEAGQVNYTIPSFLNLTRGSHNLTLSIRDQEGNLAELSWNFTVSDPPPPSKDPFWTLRDVVVLVATILAVLLVSLVAFAAYMRFYRGWTLRKFLVRYPIKSKVLVIYIPVAAAVLLALAGLGYSSMMGAPFRYWNESSLVAAFVLAALPSTLSTMRGQTRRLAYEKAFAQLLFEMADAIRGGIDPQKALKEMAEGGANALRPHLRLAVDRMRRSKPFHEVLVQLGDATNSTLVRRYAGLVGEASRAGGDISIVVYRAAKDMDDLVKIGQDRARQLKMPMVTMYIAFGVLFLLVTTLVDFAPTLQDLDVAAIKLGGADQQEEPASIRTVERMDLVTLEMRFFHLLLISSLGTGLSVGSFTHGKLRFGLLHAIVMLSASAVAYPLMTL